MKTQPAFTHVSNLKHAQAKMGRPDPRLITDHRNKPHLTDMLNVALDLEMTAPGNLSLVRMTHDATTRRP